MNRFTHWLMVILLLCMTGTVSAQRNKAYEDYIKKYRSVAVDEMKHYRIPASITLAQGLLESGAGRSQLARKSNNHFGIKCGGAWDGPSKHAKDSYRDHSKFLRSGARYAFLFRLKITDYKGWAKGLKKAGYATDPRYATRLINIIETYDLDKYDRKGGLKWAEEFPNPHQPYLANELLYVIARPGDTFKSIAKEFDLKKKNVRKYNELPKDYRFNGGEIVYLEEKRKKATKDHISYTVKEGDSMYGISQMFGVKLKNLYKLNGLDPETASLRVGDIIWLR